MYNPNMMGSPRGGMPTGLAGLMGMFGGFGGMR